MTLKEAFQGAIESVEQFGFNRETGKADVFVILAHLSNVCGYDVKLYFEAQDALVAGMESDWPKSGRTKEEVISLLTEINKDNNE